MRLQISIISRSISVIYIIKIQKRRSGVFNRLLTALAMFCFLAIDSVFSAPRLSQQIFLKDPKYQTFTIDHRIIRRRIQLCLLAYVVSKFQAFHLINHSQFYKTQHGQDWDLIKTFNKPFKDKPNWTKNHFLDVRIQSSDHHVQKPLLPCIEAEFPITLR